MGNIKGLITEVDYLVYFIYSSESVHGHEDLLDALVMYWESSDYKSALEKLSKLKSILQEQDVSDATRAVDASMKLLTQVL